MNERQIQQLIQVKYYLALAEAQRRIGQRESNFAAMNLLHEGFEATLITLAEHMNAAIPERATIDNYFNKIDERLANRSLPFRQKMMQFNRARVLCKHSLTLPDTENLISFFVAVPEFCAESVRIVFEVELLDVDLSSLIKDSVLRQLILEAVEFRKQGDFYAGLASIRKVFFLSFEKGFDVSAFIDVDDSEKVSVFSPGFSCRAPAYAKSNRYVRERVRDPFGYIVLDHSAIDAELLKDGIDPKAFWNIWRLTPAVWQRPMGTWIVKQDINILKSVDLEDDLRYVIETMIKVVLTRQSSRNLERYKDSLGLWAVKTRSNIPLYSKASKESKVSAITPSDVEHLYVMDAVQGLDTDDWFWNAYYMKKGGPFHGGYLSFDDAEGEVFFGPNPLG